MNGIRAAKNGARAAYLVVWALTLVVVAGPILGAATPQVLAQQQPLGLGIDLRALQSQVNSSVATPGTHVYHVPAFNNWPLSGSAGLSLALVVKGQTLYQTPQATVRLGAFQSGMLDVSMEVTPALASQLRGQNVTIGGTMTLSEGGFWTIAVNLSQ